MNVVGDWFYKDHVMKWWTIIFSEKKKWWTIRFQRVLSAYVNLAGGEEPMSLDDLMLQLQWTHILISSASHMQDN